MATAIIEMPLVNGVLQLPNNHDESFLHEIINGKARDGCGYSCIGQVYPNSTHVLMVINTSEAILTTMYNSGIYRYFERIGNGAPLKPIITRDQSLLACGVTIEQYSHSKAQAQALGRSII